MPWIVRWFATGLVVVAVLILWWYPVPAVYVVEQPNWALDYESRYQAPTTALGSLALFQEAMRHASPYVPLSSYILEQMENRPLFEVVESRWNSLSLPDEGPLYVPVTHSAFTDVTREPGLLQLRDERGIFLLRFRSVSAVEYSRHQLPHELRYPIRAYGLWIVAFGLVGITMLSRMPVDRRISASSIGPLAAILALLLGLSFGLVGWPFFHGVLDGDMSYASLFIGGFLCLSLGIGLLLLRPYIAMMVGFFSLRGVLVHWWFTPEEWQPIGQKRLRSKQTSQSVVWFFVTALALAISGYIAVTVASSLSFVALAGAIVIASVWRVLLHAAWKVQRGSEGLQGADVYVGLDGLYCAGEVHRWKGIFSRLVSAEVSMGQHSELHICYATLGATSVGGRGIPWLYWNHFSVDVPIPRGKEEEAKQLARYLVPLRKC